MRNKLFTALILLTIAAPCGAQRFAVVVAGNSRIYKLIAAELNSSLKGTVEQASLSDPRLARLAMSKLKGFGPDVVVAVGEDALRNAESVFPHKPIVAVAVVNPEDSGILKSNICAISLDLAPSDYLNVLKEAFPKLRSVGTIYNPENSGNFVTKLRTQAKGLGLDLLTETVSEAREVGSAARRLIPKVDVYLLLFDPSLLSMEVYQALLDVSVANRTPLLVPAAALLKRGALISLEADYAEMGAQSAEIANGIAQGTKAPSVVGSLGPRAHTLGVNLKAAQLLGITLSDALIGRAKHVHK